VCIVDRSESLRSNAADAEVSPTGSAPRFGPAGVPVVAGVRVVQVVCRARLTAARRVWRMKSSRRGRCGFAIDELTELLSLTGGGPDSWDAVRDLAQTKIETVSSKISLVASSVTSGGLVILRYLASRRTAMTVDRPCARVAMGLAANNRVGCTVRRGSERR
jgi:hypothetical protein